MSTSTATTGDAGRAPGGRGRGGRSGRGYYRGSGRGEVGGPGRSGSGRTTFKGDTEDMNGNVFQCFSEQRDRRQYEKTVEALEGYVKKTLKYHEDIADLFDLDEMRNPEIQKPKELGEKATDLDKAIQQEEAKDYVKRTRILKSNMSTIFSVIWGQCSEDMKTKLKSTPGFAEATKEDCTWLLKKIKGISLKFDEKRNGFLSALDARGSFLNCRQKQGQTNVSYRDEMKAWADTIEFYGGSVAECYLLVPENGPDGAKLSVSERKKVAKDRTLGVAYIRRADTDRYGLLITELSNNYAKGKDEYPTSLQEAFERLESYTLPTLTRARGAASSGNHATATPGAASPEASAMTFAQASGVVAGNNGETHETVECFQCHAYGHYANECPQRAQDATSGTTLVQYAYMLAQAAVTEIDPDWILLDSQSTISVFRNASMLTNIRPSDHVLRALTNGGHQDSNMVGDFPNLGTVWYNSASIANILSLSDVRKVCRVTMDTHKETAMCVHRLDGSVMRFVEHPSGLYVFNSSNKNVTDYTMLTTVTAQ